MNKERKENIARRILIALYVYCLMCCNYNAFKKFEYCEVYSPSGWSLVWVVAQIVFWVALCIIDLWSIAGCVSDIKWVVVTFTLVALIFILVVVTANSELILGLSIIIIAIQGVALGVYCELEDEFMFHYR